MQPAIQINKKTQHAQLTPAGRCVSLKACRPVSLQQQQQWNFYYAQRSSGRSTLTCRAAQEGFSSSVSTAAAPNNLGVLQRVVEVDPGMDDPYGMQRVSVDSFSSRGFYMDGPSIISSAVLLLVLLALTFQRILGLDRLITKAVRGWKDSRELERRSEVLRARQSLEDSWDQEKNS